MRKKEVGVVLVVGDGDGVDELLLVGCVSAGAVADGSTTAAGGVICCLLSGSPVVAEDDGEFIVCCTLFGFPTESGMTGGVATEESLGVVVWVVVVGTVVVLGVAEELSGGTIGVT